MQCDFRKCLYGQIALTHVLDMGELFLASGSANGLYHLTITLDLITMKYNSFWREHEGKKDAQMSLTLLNALLNNAWLLEYHGDADYRRKNRKAAPLPRGTQGSGWHPARAQLDLETLKTHVMGTVNSTFVNLD